MTIKPLLNKNLTVLRRISYVSWQEPENSKQAAMDTTRPAIISIPTQGNFPYARSAENKILMILDMLMALKILLILNNLGRPACRFFRLLAPVLALILAHPLISRKLNIGAKMTKSNNQISPKQLIELLLNYQSTLSSIEKLEAYLESLTHSFNHLSDEEQQHLIMVMKNCEKNLNFFSEYFTHNSFSINIANKSNNSKFIYIEEGNNLIIKILRECSDKNKGERL